jgi:hypothetical protein
MHGLQCRAAAARTGCFPSTHRDHLEIYTCRRPRARLQVVAHEACVDGRARGADRATQQRRDRVQALEALRALQPAAACRAGSATSRSPTLDPKVMAFPTVDPTGMLSPTLDPTGVP